MVVVVLLVGLVALFGGGENNTEVLVWVKGDSGIEFTGNITTADRGPRRFEGTVPHGLLIEVKRGILDMGSVSALVQNEGSSGTLTVQILEGGEVRKKATTTAPYGVAGVDWVPGEK